MTDNHGEAEMYDRTMRVHTEDLARLIDQRDELARLLRAGEEAWADGERRWSEKVREVNDRYESLRGALHGATGYDGWDVDKQPLSDDLLLTRVAELYARATDVLASPRPMTPVAGLSADFVERMAESGRAAAESLRRAVKPFRIEQLPGSYDEADETAFAEAPSGKAHDWVAGAATPAVATRTLSWSSGGDGVEHDDAGPPTESMAPVQREPRVFTVDQPPPSNGRLLLDTTDDRTVVWEGNQWRWDDGNEGPRYDWPPPAETGPWTEDVPPVKDTMPVASDG